MEDEFPNTPPEKNELRLKKKKTKGGGLVGKTEGLRRPKTTFRIPHYYLI